MKRSIFEQRSKPELIEIILRLEERGAALEARCAKLEEENAVLRRENATLKARCVTLESELAKARKDSSNSSKPPSSDIVKPPRPKGRARTGRSAVKPGHERHTRPPFPPEQVDNVKKHPVTRCPDCGGALKPLKLPPKVVQQVELVKRPIIVTEQLAHPFSLLPDKIRERLPLCER
jgi:regulator of replication initiation timing